MPNRPPDAAHITVLLRRDVAAPRAGTPYDTESVRGLPLREALAAQWPTDAHFTAYAPVTFTLDGADDTDTAVARVTLDMLDGPDPIAVSMVALVGDIDAPDHAPTPEWREAAEYMLTDAGLAWYRTRGGLRVIQMLPDPIVIDSPRGAAEWQELYLGWREWIQEAAALSLDWRCKDLTRLYRLPNVIRDGRRNTSELGNASALERNVFDRAKHTLPVGWAGLAAGGCQPPSHIRRASTTDRGAAPGKRTAEIARATALAERLPPSVEGHAGDAALFRAAREIATIIGEDAAAIESVLTETYNPRCAPPWDPSKIKYEVKRAVAAVSTPEARFGRRMEERALAAANGGAAANDTAYRSATEPGDDDPFAAATLDIDGDEDPVEYYCEGLRIGPSSGKISIIAGLAGASKGVLAGHLALCFGLGQRVFEIHDCAKKRVGILDFEGARLTRTRLQRLAAGMGVPARSVTRDRVQLVDATGLGDLNNPANFERLRAWVTCTGVEVLIIDSYMTAMLASGLDPNSPLYANLARMLGSLGICVIVVAHAAKALAKEDREPRLTDIAYTGAFAALAQTAITMYYPDPEDRYTVRIGCARAPEESFASFGLRWKGAKGEPLIAEVIVDAPTEAPAGGAAGGAPRSDPREARVERKRQTEAARNADRIVSFLKSADSTHHGLVVGAIRSGLSLGVAQCGDALQEAARRGTLEVIPAIPTDRVIRYRVAEREPGQSAPVTITRPLPIPGTVASHGSARGKRR